MSPASSKRDSKATISNGDGEHFDISNLLGALPDEEDYNQEEEDLGVSVSALDVSNKTDSNYQSCRSNFSNGANNNKSIRNVRYPTQNSVMGFSAKIDEDGQGFFDPEESFVLNEDYRQLATDYAHEIEIDANKQRRNSGISCLTMSTFASKDVPGIIELHESMSSFSESLLDMSNSGSNKSDPLDIEISPGIFLPFRGSDDTWKAIKNGRYKTVQCFDCSMDMVCAKDCEYVICPDQACHAVNPVIGVSGKSTHFGVLMGFRKEWCGDYYKENQAEGGAVDVSA